MATTTVTSDDEHQDNIIPYPMPNLKGKITTEAEMIDWAVRQLAGKARLGKKMWSRDEAAEFGTALWQEFEKKRECT